MATHRIFSDHPLNGRETRLTIVGDEAQHALRVKRLGPGDPVVVLDGLGKIARCRIAASGKTGRDWSLDLSVEQVEEAPRVTPRVEVVSAAPKGARLADLIDGLSQVGTAAWSPLDSARSITEPGPGKLDRLERTAAEAAKQSGRAWRLEIGGAMRLADALRGPRVVLADVTGGAYEPTLAPTIRLLIGPEGGWTPEELAAARQASACIARFGPHTMRIETAATVAAGILLDIESRAARA
jgi:16S rRNA (uracil1498-N3)-methyltransferase